MIEESMKYAKQNQQQSYKAPSRNGYQKISLTKHTNQLSNLWPLGIELFCMFDKLHGAGSQASVKAQLDWSGAYKEKDFFRMKQCRLMLQRCHLRHGMRCM